MNQDTLLYFNGDSFVQGVELGDDILPGHPGNIFYEIDNNSFHAQKAKEWLLSTHRDVNSESFKFRKQFSKKIFDLEQERSFPAKVQKITGIEVLNKAIGGASLDRIVRTSLTDLIETKHNFPNKNIIAFIGTTQISRSEVPSENLKGVDFLGVPMDWESITGHYATLDESNLISSVKKFKILYEKNYHLLVNFYKNVLLLQSFCELNNIKLFWLAVLEDIPLEIICESDYYDRLDLRYLQKVCNFNYKLNLKKIMINFQNENSIPGLCPGGHYSEIVHEKIAEHIVKIITE